MCRKIKNYYCLSYIFRVEQKKIQLLEGPKSVLDRNKNCSFLLRNKEQTNSIDSFRVTEVPAAMKVT